MKYTLRRKRQGTKNRRVVTMLVALGAAVLLTIGTFSVLHTVQATGSDTSAAKEQILEQQEQEMATARAHPRPKSLSHANAPSPQAAPQRQAGIVGMHQGPFPASRFTVRNFWQGPVGSSWELVYSGARKNADGSLGPGALRVYTETPDTAGGFKIDAVGMFVAPGNQSALTITSYNGTILQLQTDAGKTLSFNLLTNQYN